MAPRTHVNVIICDIFKINSSILFCLSFNFLNFSSVVIITVFVLLKILKNNSGLSCLFFLSISSIIQQAKPIISISCICSMSMHTRKAGLRTHGLDACTLEGLTLGFWILGLRTTGALDLRRLDAWTLDDWTLILWTLGPRNCFPFLRRSIFLFLLFNVEFFECFERSTTDVLWLF